MGMGMGMGMGVGSTVTTLHPSSSSLAHPALWPSRTILSIPRSRFSSLSLAVARSAPDSQGTGAPATAEEEPFSILTALSSQYNDSIMVIDTPSARFLLLDSTRNVHSMIKKDQVWTGSYWDEFASLPAIIPHGPIAMLGLGAGTAAHSILEYYPSFHIIGWELDELLINAARKYFNLSKLEEKNEHGGYLSVCIGDALSPDATVEGGFAGIIVDLFADGKILPELVEEETWVGLAKKLMPNGRIMVNCSGRDDYQYYRDNKIAPPKSKHSWMENSAIKALSRALPAGQVCWKLVEEAECENYFALTGPLPDLDAWSTLVPEKLKKLRIMVLVHTYSAIKALSHALPSGQVCWKLVEEAECENYFALTGPLPDLDAWLTLVPAKLSMKVKLWQRV